MRKQKSAEAGCLKPFYLFFFIFLYSLQCCKKIKIWEPKRLRQPASADFWVFSTCCFKFIQQKVERTQISPKKISWELKSAEAGCLKFKFAQFLFFLQCKVQQRYQFNVCRVESCSICVTKIILNHLYSVSNYIIH